MERVRRQTAVPLCTEIRWDILPPLSRSAPGVSMAGVLEPAYEVAGDAFDYALNGALLHAAILDAMGQPLEASRIADPAVGGYHMTTPRSRSSGGAPGPTEGPGGQSRRVPALAAVRGCALVATSS